MHLFSRCVHSGSWSPLIGQWQGKGVFNHCSWFWRPPPGFTAFLGLELKQLRPRCYLQGGEGRRGKNSPVLGVEVLVFPVLPPAGLEPFALVSAPGCKLLGHRVQLCVSVSLFHSPRNFASFLSQNTPASSWGDSRRARQFCLMPSDCCLCYLKHPYFQRGSPQVPKVSSVLSTSHSLPQSRLRPVSEGFKKGTPRWTLFTGLSPYRYNPSRACSFADRKKNFFSLNLMAASLKL